MWIPILSNRETRNGLNNLGPNEVHQLNNNGDLVEESSVTPLFQILGLVLGRNLLSAVNVQKNI